MNEQESKQLLSALPEHRASDRFTARVMERLDEPRRKSLPRLLAAAAVAAFVIAGAGLWTHAEQERREEARIEALRAERASISRELEELKRLTSEVEEPVIEIEREGVDVVIDLREKSSVVPAKQALPPI